MALAGEERHFALVTDFATPEELPTKPYLTFASAWPVRGSGSPANSRAAAVRVGAVLLFFHA
jgi:hypothetical protein